MKRVQLREICHARAGDKGDVSNIGLAAYDMKDYDLIKREVTAGKVKEFFKGIVKGEVQRFELPQLGALNFVMYGALGGGSSRSLRMDAFGKSLSSMLLAMKIDKPD